MCVCVPECYFKFKLILYFNDNLKVHIENI